MTSRRIALAALVVMVFFVLSRFTGLAREIFIGARFGTGGDYDAYLAAFRIPDLIFQLVAGGALGSAFIPVFAQPWTRGDQSAAWLLFSRVLTLVTLLLMALALLAALFAGPLVARIIAPGFTAEQQALTVALMRTMLLGTVVFGASGLVMGALNATQHFLWPAAAPVVYNAAIIAAAWLFAPRFGIPALAWGVVAGSLLHLLVQLPQLVHTGARYTPDMTLRDAGVSEVMRLMGPRVLGLFFVQMHFLVNTILASGLATGSLSALNYAWLIMLLPLGIFGQSVATAVFPAFSAQVAQGDRAGMQRTFGQTLRSVLFLIVPSAVGLLLLGRPIITMLLQRGEFTASSAALVATALSFYVLGLAGHATLEIVVRAFYALHNTWTPVLVGVAAMVLNIVLGLLLVRPLSFGGLALANSTATTIEALLLLWLLRRVMGGIDAVRLGDSLLRTVAASAIMAASLWLLLRWPVITAEPVTTALAGIALALVVYGIASALVRHPELRAVLALAARRLRR